MAEQNGKKGRMQDKRESYYQGRIIEAVRKQFPGAFIWKAQAGPYSRRGIPDVLMVLEGHFFAFEVKRPKYGRLSDLQRQAIAKIRAAGGYATVVSWPDEAIDLINAVLDGVL